MIVAGSPPNSGIERHLFERCIGATSCEEEEEESSRRLAGYLTPGRFLWTDSRTGRSTHLPPSFALPLCSTNNSTENLLFGSKNERGRTSRRTFSQILSFLPLPPSFVPPFLAHREFCSFLSLFPTSFLLLLFFLFLPFPPSFPRPSSPSSPFTRTIRSCDASSSSRDAI